MSFTQGITKEVVGKVDVAKMGDAIAGMGGHLRDAAIRSKQALDSFSLPKKNEIANIVLAGLGGSAIGGDLVRSYIIDHTDAPYSINRTYNLPGFVNEKSLVIASSYSGSTEESLSMFDEALKRRAKIVCITTGGKLAALATEHKLPLITLPTGFQPRAALAYSFVPVLLTLEKIGFTAGESANISDAAETLDTLTKRYAPSNLTESNAANRLAHTLLSKIPVIYSASDLFDSVNIRWRGQIQENAKHVAFGNVLPEMNHNEINGWDFPHNMQDKFHVIFLRSPADEHPRVGKRFEILHEVLTSKDVEVTECRAEGTTVLARIFSLISFADWTSYYLALLEGVDPSPVPVISQLKSKLV